MTRFLDRLASLPIMFLAGGCEASIIYVPCEQPITAMTPVHFAPHPVKHKRHVVHHGTHRRTPHSFRLVTAGAMCPLWVGEGETNANLADDFDHAYGGGYLSEEAATDIGGDEGGWFGGFGGGAGGGSDVPDLFLLTLDTPPSVAPPDTPPGPPVIPPPLPPPPLCCGPTPPPLAVPELSTWMMGLIGFACLGFSAFRQRLATVSQWRK